MDYNILQDRRRSGNNSMIFLERNVAMRVLIIYLMLLSSLSVFSVKPQLIIDSMVIKVAPWDAVTDIGIECSNFETSIDYPIKSNVSKNKTGAKANFVSKVMTDIVGHAENKHIFNFSFSTSTLHNGGIGFSLNPKSHFTTEKRKGEVKVRIEAHEDIGVDYEATVENLSSSLIVHEWYSHGIKGYGDKKKNHRLAYLKVMEDKTFYPKTTKKYKEFVKSKYNKYKNKEVK